MQQLSAVQAENIQALVKCNTTIWMDRLRKIVIEMAFMAGEVAHIIDWSADRRYQHTHSKRRPGSALL